MSVKRLGEKRVEKVWGRRDLPEMFGARHGGDEPLGEIWFADPDGSDPELLVKYLFTSEKLSIQVHPDDAGARRAGHKRGKDEAWIVLHADPGATIGLGLRQRVAPEELRRAALDGSIEELVDWRPAAAGDIIYSPARTVHALGPGLILIEIQQNVDLTYRLYDYGRPRELHLDAGIEASNPAPYRAPMIPYTRPDGREILAEGGAFVLERWSRPGRGVVAATEGSPVWLVPVAGKSDLSGRPMEPGSVWLADGDAAIALEEGTELYVAYSGAHVREALIAEFGG